MKKNLLILTALFTVVIGYSQTFTDSNFIQYTIVPSTNTVEITDYDYTNGGPSVNIPTTIDYNSATYNVTSIGNLAFYTDLTIGEHITNLIFTLPSNIISIDENAFNGNHLTNVTIPDSVISIASQAFAFNDLTNIVIGNNVETISGNAFKNNDLTSITIPVSVTSIGSSAFRNNDLLTCVISEATTPPTIVTGTNDTFLNLRSNIDLSIPSGTSSAYTSAGWTGFNSVAEGLTGTFVVDNITYQINATPNNEVTITDYNTAGGTDVTIPATVSSACTSFSVVSIGASAFNGKSLTSVTIPNSVIIINNEAFRDNNLMTISIPDSVTIIGDSAFAENQLNNVALLDGLITIGEYAFGVNQLTNISIPNSVTNIGDYAFLYNVLTNVTISSSVISIGGGAFFNNTLTDVTSLATIPPTIFTGSNDTFGVNNRPNIHLHIPPGTLAAYVTDTGALWTGFNPVTEDAALSTSNFELANDIKIISITDKVEIKHSNKIKLQHYSIYSITGTKIKAGKESTININALSNGIYILELNFNTGRLVKKFAK